MRHLFALASGLAISVSVTGCVLTADDISCKANNKTTGTVETCIEYGDFSTAASVNAKASLEILCKGFNASVDEKKCDRTGSLVGCTKNYQNAWIQTQWYWATPEKTMASDFSCASNEMKIDVNGNAI